MSKIQLLDCTLRDGGYINDWEFGQNNLIRIFERLSDSGVDIVEVGFIDDRRPFDVNRSIFPDTKSISKIWGCVNKRPPMVVGMIDYGTCDLVNIEPCKDSFLDGIRVIFKKHRMKEALEYCANIKALGYKVFVQMVSVTSYSDEELVSFAEMANSVEPYAVSMVDTYGLLNPVKLLHVYEILDRELKPEIHIGFHAHNNLQLAYANAITFLEKEIDRDILVDGTLFGMGKSAGNAPLELIAGYLNKSVHYNLAKEKYNVNAMLESIEESIMEIYQYSPWGYKTFYYLAAENECHPSYVSFFEGKQNLSPAKINSILEQLNSMEESESDDLEDICLLYDRGVAENVYENYRNQFFDDKANTNILAQEIGNRPVLLMGPGKNIRLQEDKVSKYIEDNNPVRISLNYLPKLGSDIIFLTKPNRYLDLTVDLHKEENRKIRLAATTNLEACGNDEFIAVFDREPLLEKQEEILDNPFLMLLRILKQAGITRIACAGLDGYSDREDNYINPQMEYGFLKDAANRLNRHIRNVLQTEYRDMDIEFITYSHYSEVEDVNSGTY